MNRFTTAVCIVSAVLIQLFLYSANKNYIQSRASDFAPLYASGKVVWTDQRTHVYEVTEPVAPREDPLAHRGTVQDPDRLHPPFEHLIYALLAPFPYMVAFTAWFCFNGVLLIGIPFFMRTHLPHVRDNVGLLVLGSALFFPAILALLQGQNSILLLSLISGAFVALRKEHNRAAGLLLALAMFRFQFVLALLVGIVALRGRRVLTGFAAGCGVLLLASVAAVGFQGVWQYPKAVFAFSELPTGSRAVWPALMPNLRGLMNFLLPVDIGGWRTAVAVLLSIACLILQFRVGAHFRHRDARNFPLVFSFMILVATLVPYHQYSHDLAVLLLPLFLVCNRVAGPPRSPALLPLATAVVIIWILPALVYAAFVVPVIAVLTLLFCAAIAVELSSGARSPAGATAEGVNSVP